MDIAFRYAVSTQWERQVADGTAPRDVHAFFCCCATRIGHMFALLSFPDGTPIVVAGPCWPFCAFVTLPLILGVSVVVSYFMVIDKNVFDLVRMFALVVVLYACAQSSTFLTLSLPLTSPAYVFNLSVAFAMR
jgi:hypothetical protein